MRIAVCDDDPKEQEQLCEVLREWDPMQHAEKYPSGSSLLEEASRVPHFDIVFLDIYMPGESGIDIARELRERSPETGIAFVTTSKEHAVDAFSLHALHYLVKPVTAEGAAETFRRLAEIRSKERKKISLVVGPDRYTVFQDQICFLENDNHAVIISLADGRRLKVWVPLGEIERKLEGNFLRINRGIIVNMDYIVQMGTDTCILRDGSRLPITIRRSAAIRAAYDNYVFDLLSQRKDLNGGVNHDGFFM